MGPVLLWKSMDQDEQAQRIHSTHAAVLEMRMQRVGREPSMPSLCKTSQYACNVRSLHY